MGISGSTGKPLSKPPFSNIRDHHQSSGRTLSLLMISPFCPPALHLLNSKLKPSFNANLSSIPLTLYNQSYIA